MSKIIRKERFKNEIKRNLRKAKIVSGLVLTLAGGTLGTINAIDARAMLTNPVVQQYKSAMDGFNQALNRWRTLPANERMVYTEQSEREDYSASQAHSEIESAWQNLMFAKGNVRNLGENPEVRDFVNTENGAFYGYAVGGLGLLLGIFGLRRRRN